MIAGRIISEISRRLEFLDAVGLNRQLDSQANTLSGGESNNESGRPPKSDRSFAGFSKFLDEPAIRSSPQRQCRLLATPEELRNSATRS